MFENISVKEALRLAIAKEAWIFDIREEKIYQEGHLPTAIWAPEERIRDFIVKKPKRKQILYCDFGNQSMRLARELDEEGFPVASVVGGYRAYEGFIEKKKDKIWIMEWKNPGHL